MRKHSPSPWHYGGHGVIYDSNGDHVCAVESSSDFREGNGHVLAASLKMLEALEAVDEALPRENWSFGHKVRAAIEMARGEDQ